VVWSGQTSCPAQWVELDLNGTLLRQAPVENCAYRFAYTADGHVYRQKQGSDQLLVLDQNTLTWKDTGASHGVHVSLLGADGNQLVFSPDGKGPELLQWFEQPNSPNP
jgi:hypothetical protein